MSLNLGSILMASAHERPQHVAVRLNQRALSFAELDRAARGVAASLHARGVRPGQAVAVMVPNVPEFTIAYFGILYAGCTVVPLNVLLSAPEVAYHIQDSEAVLLIAHPLFREPASKGAQGAGVGVAWSDGGAPDDLPAMAEAAPLEALYPTSPDDTAVILYTSGTTGKPKGAELTHSNLFVNCAVVVPKLIPIPPDQHVALATLPLFHSFGQTAIQNATIANGGTFTLLPRFSPGEAFEIMERDRVTLFAGVPTMYFALLHHEGAPARVPSLRWCMSGGAPLPVEVMKAFEDRFGVEILEGYGLSETSPVASFNMPGRTRTPGSIGYAVWGVEMAILDDKDRPLPDGERGEIAIRGHNIMKGYWKRPEATAETMRGGWFHSGDIGIRDANGSYRIVDRVKDMIIRGGFNVYPREVEEVLYAHPAIVEAAVIGIPHASHGEEVKAVVALAKGQTAGADEIIAWCRERLAAYKYPRIVDFVEALPKGPTGKILK
ncbi:MAG: long-chain-fatty-acid--CoA ligase, partial [Myxococcota bacterium]